VQAVCVVLRLVLQQAVCTAGVLPCACLGPCHHPVASPHKSLPHIPDFSLCRYFGCALCSDTGACVGSASLWDVVALTRDGLSAEDAEVLLEEPIDRFLRRLPPAPTLATGASSPGASSASAGASAGGPGSTAAGDVVASSVPLGEGGLAALAVPVGGAALVEPGDSLLTVIELLAVSNVHRAYILDPVSRAALGVVTIPDVLRLLLAPAVVVPAGALDTPLLEAALPISPAGPDHPLTAILHRTTVCWGVPALGRRRLSPCHSHVPPTPHPSPPPPVGPAGFAITGYPWHQPDPRSPMSTPPSPPPPPHTHHSHFAVDSALTRAPVVWLVEQVAQLLEVHGTPFEDIKDIGEDASIAQVLELLNESKVWRCAVGAAGPWLLLLQQVLLLSPLPREGALCCMRPNRCLPCPCTAWKHPLVWDWWEVQHPPW
jgi:CBS domain-containing protein